MKDARLEDAAKVWLDTESFILCSIGESAAVSVAGDINVLWDPDSEWRLPDKDICELSMKWQLSISNLNWNFFYHQNSALIFILVNMWV